MASRDPEVTRRGGCLCGAVRYAVTGPLRDVTICHCHMCQRAHGHVGAYTACAPDALVVESADALRWHASSPEARRGFCGGCGAQLFWAPVHGRHVSIAAGTLDPPTGLVTAKHIYVAEKGDYYRLDGSLPQEP